MVVSKKKRWQTLEQQITAQIERDTDFILFKQVLIGEVSEKELTIYVRDNFSKGSIENNFSKKILELVKNYEEYNNVDSLLFMVKGQIFRKHDAERELAEEEKRINLNKEIKKETVKSKDEKVNDEDISDILSLNDKFTFEHFVVGSSNELAYAYAEAVAKEPGEKANPFFIYGGSGLGKTHLIQAIGHYISENSKGKKKVAYVTSEKFTNDFIEAIKFKTANKFREKYRQVDVLLIDDIQFLVGKTETQKEFFHTFNTLVDGKKQIILTSDKPPAKLDSLEERLVSRFKAGLIADVQKPNLELRIAILQNEAKEMNVEIKYELIEYIAQQVVSNIRELEGAFNTLISYKSITGRELTEESIDRILKDFIADIGPKKVSIEEIQREVADYYRVSKDDILSSKRDKKIVKPRQMAMYLSRDLTGKSTTAISKEFGKKDHTTVIHACKKIEALMKEDKGFLEDFRELRRKLLD